MVCKRKHQTRYCRFRVNTVAEAQAVCKSVSEQTERDTAFSEFVCPFAYRIARAGGCRSEAQSDGSPTAAAAAAAASPENGGDEEGYGDNGDVGSGEKLLYLLQKWDIRDRAWWLRASTGGLRGQNCSGFAGGSLVSTTAVHGRRQSIERSN